MNAGGVRSPARRLGPVGRRTSATGSLAVAGVAGMVWVGAMVASPVSVWVPAALAAGASGVRRWRGASGLALVIAALAAGCVASALAADAWAGLDHPVPSRLDGRVELVGDPRPTRFGVRAEIRAGGRLWDLTADGGAAGVLGDLRAGESVVVEATTRVREDDDLWRASRHVVGTAHATAVRAPAPAWGPWRLANAVHRALLRSTQHLAPEARGVALGVALGDRGAIDELLADDLRAAGMSHLTAVSGQHVALLVAMAAPLLRRLAPRTALVATLGLLGGFVVLTRGEPSVLRATAMAAVVALVHARGRRVAAVRVLAVVVAVLVLIDPMLVWSVGFQLSVAATIGIAVGAARLGAAIPGPRAVAAVLGVSLAAQLAVAPLVIAYFGVMPLVGLVTNLAVAPSIGPLMGWTLAAGLVGGLVPAVAELVHLPTGLLAGWVVRVAEWAAGLGLPGLRLPVWGWPAALGTGVLGVVALGWWIAMRRYGELAVETRTPARRSGAGRFAAAAVVGLLCLVGVAGSMGAEVSSGRHALGAGAELVVGGGRTVLIVDGRAAAGLTMGGLRELGVDRVDVLVLRSQAASTLAIAEALAQRVTVSAILAPAPLPLDGATVVDGREALRLGAHEVVVASGRDGRLDVSVSGPV